MQLVNIIEQLPAANGHLRQHRALSEIKYILVHYRAGPRVDLSKTTPLQGMVNDANYHIGKNWGAPGGPAIPGFGLMYHYAVDLNGRQWQTQPETLVAWHGSNGNRKALAIECQLGAGQLPSQAMLKSLEELLDWLCERPDIPATRADVFGHGETSRIYGGGPDFGNNTNCPGLLIDFVRHYRNAPPPPPESRYFPETGQYVAHGFLEMYVALESAEVLPGVSAASIVGLPITGEQEERIGEWVGTVQYFERARMEYDPLAPEGRRVLFGLLGAEILEGR